jgi:hypothetical protein
MEKMKNIGGEQMRELASMIQEKIPRPGFALLVFPFHNEGISNYISNAKREDMIKAFEEVLERWKKNQDFMTPETN